MQKNQFERKLLTIQELFCNISIWYHALIVRFQTQQRQFPLCVKYGDSNSNGIHVYPKTDLPYKKLWNPFHSWVLNPRVSSRVRQRQWGIVYYSSSHWWILHSYGDVTSAGGGITNRIFIVHLKDHPI
jgi:hypothetical protein